MNVCNLLLAGAHSFTRGKSDVKEWVNCIDNSPKIRFVAHLANTVFYYLQSVAKKYAFVHIKRPVLA